MYERILVPTDGSTGVERAVEHAIDLASAHGATIHAVYVVNTASYGGIPMETSWDGIRDVLSEEGESALERVKTLAADSGVAVEPAVLDGSPSRRIVDYAEQADCDLIVMGTHGRGGLDRLLLGSVAERVVRSSEIPVLTVRVGEAPDAAERTEAEAGDAEEAAGTTDATGTPEDA
jgi:nucleotide-binding universal stress UspA family protein